MALTEDMRSQYIALFDGCQTRPNHENDVKGFINTLMLGVRAYQDVEIKTSVPWYVIGLIHGMEGSFDFHTHLHNGDSLNHRTVNEPKGRPPSNVGDPPFSWQVSAIDALNFDRFTSWTDWSVAGICYRLESYNGWGYRAHHINSPYLWSYSNQYTSGKFVADGIFDLDAVSKQVGSVTALKQMVTDHLVTLSAASV